MPSHIVSFTSRDVASVPNAGAILPNNKVSSSVTNARLLDAIRNPQLLVGILSPMAGKVESLVRSDFPTLPSRSDIELTRFLPCMLDTSTSDSGGLPPTGSGNGNGSGGGHGEAGVGRRKRRIVMGGLLLAGIVVVGVLVVRGMRAV